MNKKYHHHIWTRLMAVKPWYFLIIALVSFVVCATALRQNNQQMIKLRDAVYAADRDNGDVQGTLQALQAYVLAHMNTNLSAGPQAVHPPIQLKYTYDRLVKAQSDQLATSNTAIYNDAQHSCEAQNPTDFSGRNRIPCIEQYVTSHGVNLPVIPDALYKFDFISPKWSPDLAGWSMLIAIISTLLFVATFITQKIFKPIR